MSKKNYSNAFQMHEQQGSFIGIDTCNITSYRKFNFQLSLLTHSESTTILNRPDINSLLNQLIEEKIISKTTANGKRSFASSKYSNFDFSKYYIGSTYVPFAAVISMQRDLSNCTIINVTIDER